LRSFFSPEEFISLDAIASNLESSSASSSSPPPQINFDIDDELVASFEVVDAADATEPNSGDTAAPVIDLDLTDLDLQVESAGDEVNSNQPGIK
jgi:hypothetical protein